MIGGNTSILFYFNQTIHRTTVLNEYVPPEEHSTCLFTFLSTSNILKRGITHVPLRSFKTETVPKVWVPLGHFHNQQNIYLEL